VPGRDRLRSPYIFDGTSSRFVVGRDGLVAARYGRPLAQLGGVS
jgi:hypothetical protein